MDRVHVLLVEDSPGDARLIQEMLSDTAMSVGFTHRERLDSALAALQSGVYDVVLLDLSLPDSQGLETFEAIQAEAPMVPVVVLTGHSDEELAVEAVQRGAQDYLGKSQVTSPLLIRTIRYSIERKRTRLALEKNQARFRALLDAVPQAIVVENARGEIVLINSRTKALFGYDLEELEGSSVQRLITPDSLERYQCGRLGFLQDPDESSDPVRGLEAITASGRRFPVEVGHSSVHTPQGRRLICLIEDVTAHHSMLERIEQTRMEELETKDRFISHVSHELRSPLTAIYLHVESFLDGLMGDVSPEQMEGLEVISRNAAELGGMIEDLIEATRAKGGELTVVKESVSLKSIVTEAMARVAQPAAERQIKLSESVPRRLDTITADRKRLLQILGNLLENAVKFSPRRGRVHVKAETTRDRPDMVVISVADQGIGVMPSERQRIFEELYQGENALQVTRKGLGLGLFICQQLVTGHGGQIWVESEPDRGSTFYLTLPRAAQSRRSAGATRIAHEVHEAVATITGS